MHSVDITVLLQQAEPTPQCHTEICRVKNATEQNSTKVDENVTSHSNMETDGADGKWEIGNIDSNLYPLKHIQRYSLFITSDLHKYSMKVCIWL